MYQGLHSIDQILFGFTLGIWLAIYFHYRMREIILAEKLNLGSWGKAAIIGFVVQVATFYLVQLTVRVEDSWT